MEDWFLILIAAMLLLVLLRVERASRDLKALRTQVEQLRTGIDKIQMAAVPAPRGEVGDVQRVDDPVRATPR